MIPSLAQHRMLFCLVNDLELRGHRLRKNENVRESEKSYLPSAEREVKKMCVIAVKLKCLITRLSVVVERRENVT